MLHSVDGGVNTLLAQHVKDLRGSGLSDETIRASGVWSETNSHIVAELLNIGGSRLAYGIADPALCPHPKTARYKACLCFPHHYLIDGNGNPLEYVRVKPDKPPINWTRLRKSKYLAPGGERIHPYFPPGIDAAFLDPSVPLIVTEGKKKALAACQAGFPTIGLPGVECWSAKKKIRNRRRLHEDLMRLAWRGRVVSIVFDADKEPKPEVQRDAKALRAALKQAGAVPHIVDLPGTDGRKVGLDDFLLERGAAALAALLPSVKTFFCVARARVYVPLSPPSPLSPYTEKSLQTFVLTADEYDTGKPCRRSPTLALKSRFNPVLALMGKQERKNASLDGSCGRWDCTACNPRLKADNSALTIDFLSPHRLGAVSLLACSSGEWRATRQRLCRNYGLRKQHFAYFRNVEQMLIVSTVPIGVDETPIPEAWETIKAFIRGMNPDGPYQCVARIPAVEDDEEEEANEDDEEEEAKESRWEREGVYAMCACDQQILLAEKGVGSHRWEDLPAGVTDAIEWDAAMMTPTKEALIKAALGLKQVLRRKPKPKPDNTTETELVG
jgi:hypothetical protein